MKSWIWVIYHKTVKRSEEGSKVQFCLVETIQVYLMVWEGKGRGDSYQEYSQGDEEGYEVENVRGRGDEDQTIVLQRFTSLMLLRWDQCFKGYSRAHNEVAAAPPGPFELYSGGVWSSRY
jgi:hypothetical protein